MTTALERELPDGQTDRRRHDLLKNFAALSEREREVLEQVVLGRLNKQIAASLGTCERTVKAHRAHVMEKLHAHSVAELVQIAMETGLMAGSAGGTSMHPGSPAASAQMRSDRGLPSGDGSPPAPKDMFTGTN